ncbi:MAG: virulence RhuM family protein [Endomicrobiaceae bacterium]
MNEKPNSEIIIYQTEDGLTKIDVRFENDTVWLTQQQMSDLFRTTKQNISSHINNAFAEEEINENATVKEYLTVQTEGLRKINRKIKYYNLDVIISVGYRVKSQQGTRFRQWATERLREYIIKGFTMDDERLKRSGGGNYWKELLNRIRDIRSSEKMLYRQVLDLYATSIDYDPNADVSIEFFKIVQNKLHYAAHGSTAAEVIYNRIDANKPFMGLTSFAGSLPTKEEAKIAKNFLTEKELKILNNLVSGYFDFAEIQAERKHPMYMKDYITYLDKILSAAGEKVLKDAGAVSHKRAMQKVDEEYKKYHIKTVTPVEKAYLEVVKSAQKKIIKKVKKNENK